MHPLFEDIRHTPLLWLLVLVPFVFLAQALKPEAHTLLFLLSVAAIVPLAALLSRATELVAAKTGDLIGGLLNATLGNLTELLITLAALRAGQYVLVKASIAGAIITNTLFMLGASFLLGGFKHHIQEYNHDLARLQGGMFSSQRSRILIPSVSRGKSITLPECRVHKFVERRPVGLAHCHVWIGPDLLAQDPSRAFHGQGSPCLGRKGMADAIGSWQPWP